MTLQRVQMLLEPGQRKKLSELAKAQGMSVAEITRQAIDAGLETLGAKVVNQRLFTALEAASRLRESMPLLHEDLLADLHQIRQERDNDLARGD